MKFSITYFLYRFTIILISIANKPPKNIYIKLCTPKYTLVKAMVIINP